jgi:hypothetical protein
VKCIRNAFLFLLLVWSVPLRAQETKYIDLSSVEQRTQLRHPPAPPANCKEGTTCLGGGSGGGGGADGAPDRRDPHALGVYLLRVTPTDINPVEPFEAEFQVRNTGSVPIQLPVWPHLSDLQPADESVRFRYLSLALVVQGEGEPQGPNVAATGFIELYGSPDYEGSVLVLKPGEWIRVRANVKLHTSPLEPVFARVRGTFWLRQSTFHPQPGGGFSEVQNLYPNVTATPSIAVHFLSPIPSVQSKQ